MLGLLATRETNMPRRPDLPCADCGTLMWSGTTSLPEGQARCLPCRRARPAQPPKRPRVYSRKSYRDCEVCGTEFRAKSPTQRTCSRTCGSKIKIPKPSKPKMRMVYIRWCAQCGGMFMGRARRTCSDACAKQGYNLTRRKTPLIAPCRKCGKGSVPYPARHCEACRRESRREERHRRRALKRGIETEPYTLAQIAKRDHYRCGLCRKRVAMTQHVPHPKAPTIDHLLPLACGGDDTRANVQLACFLCNSIKGDRGGHEQLALIG